MHTALATDWQLRLDQRPSAALVAYAQLLAAQAGDVDRLVEQELAENPPLERDDAPAALPGAVARPAPPEPADEPGVLERVDLEARLTLPSRDHAVLAYVLGSLDDHGFLTVTPADVARALGVPV